MRLGLTKPGMLAASRNPFFGFEDLQLTSDDPNDPRFTGGGGQEDDEDDDESEDDDEDDEDEEEDDKSKGKKSSSKSRKSSEDDDEDDENDSRIHKISQQSKRYRLALRAKEKEYEALEARLQAIEDNDKTPDEVATRTIAEWKGKAETLAEQNRTMMAQLAFFKTPIRGVEWIDAADVFALADRSGLFDDVIDEDGTVDERELRRSLKDLARRKPHLVKKIEDDPKAGGRKPKDDEDEEEEEDDDEEPRSRRSGSTMNGKRKGRSGTTNRAALAKKFPILNQF